jgi:hypothetical protein
MDQISTCSTNRWICQSLYYHIPKTKLFRNVFKSEFYVLLPMLNIMIGFRLRRTPKGLYKFLSLTIPKRSTETAGKNDARICWIAANVRRLGRSSDLI